jgi:hypothetical protein
VASDERRREERLSGAARAHRRNVARAARDGMRDARHVVMAGKEREKESKEEKANPMPVAAEPTKAVPPVREARAEASVRVAGLDQLREILFGAIYRDFDRRLARADVTLAARASELQQETRKRTEVLETHLRRDTEALGARVEREYAETGDAIRSLAREQHDAIAALAQRIEKIEESNVASQRELRHAMLEQAKSFLDEMQRMRRELMAMLERELGVAESQEAEELGHDGHAERATG